MSQVVVLLALLASMLLMPPGLASVRQAGASAFDGDPATTERIGQSDPVLAAVAVSQLRFGEDRSAQVAVISRVDAFADSLAGAPLTASGPLLYAFPNGFPAESLDELQRVVSDDATVYMLGGEAALQPALQDQLEGLGYTVVRLAGPSRVETSIAVAREVLARNPSRTQIAVVRADGPADNPTAGWADSISGGAWAAHLPTPLVLTPTDALHPAVQAFVDSVQPDTTWVFGGTMAVSEAAVAGLPNVQRVAGPDRAATASTVVPLYGDGVTRFVIVNGYVDTGWSLGLVAAGIAADAGAPLLFGNGDQVPPATLDRHSRPCDSGPAVDTVLVGGTDLLPDTLIGALDAADGGPCPLYDVIIESVTANPPGDDLQPDFSEHVVLRNNDPITADVSGWYIQDVAGDRLTIPPGFLLGSGAALRVHTGPGTTSAAAVYVGLPEPILSNEGDTVQLHASNGTPVGGPFSYGPQGEPPPPPPPAPPPPPPSQNCDPSYPDVCIPPPPPDLDCGDIPFRRFRVVGDDPHRFDGDGNGIGCESG